MKKLIQNRLNIPGEQIGNCFPTVIACFMDLDHPEDAFQIQEHYYNNKDGWVHLIIDWLKERGWEWTGVKGHQYDDSFYTVTGKTKRSEKVYHICIYKNGELWHDPHPDQSGLTTEEIFETIKKTS